MQQPMQHQNLQFASQRMPLLPCLLPCRLHADRQIAFFQLLDESIGGERKYIRRLVLPSKLPIELAQCGVRCQQNRDVAFQADSILRLSKEPLQSWDGWNSLSPGNLTAPHNNGRHRRPQ
jgi:hypothetical protein